MAKKTSVGGANLQDIKGVFFGAVPEEGVIETYSDTVDGEFTLQRYQPTDDLLQFCDESRKTDVFKGFRKSTPGKLVAKLPLTLVESLYQQGIDIINDDKALRKILNDPEFAYFRTTTGKV